MKKMIASILLIGITLNANARELRCQNDSFDLVYKGGMIMGAFQGSSEPMYLPTPEQMHFVVNQIDKWLKDCKGSKEIRYSVYFLQMEPLRKAINSTATSFEKFVQNNKVQFDYERMQEWNEKLQIK